VCGQLGIALEMGNKYWPRQRRLLPVTEFKRQQSSPRGQDQCLSINQQEMLYMVASKLGELAMLNSPSVLPKQAPECGD